MKGIRFFFSDLDLKPLERILLRRPSMAQIINLVVHMAPKRGDAETLEAIVKRVFL